jgi:hypothetical protein
MKYLSIFIALAALLPSSLADKPTLDCSDERHPKFELGGYNVPATTYGNNGIAMVNALWRKQVAVGGSNHNIRIWPFTYFNISYPLDTTHADVYQHLDQDGKFAFDVNADGIFRGVGVEGGDTEISDDEGLYIDFDGICTKEILFGTRAMFEETKVGVLFNESGVINFYRNGERIFTEFEVFVAWSDDDDDGQEYFRMTTAEPFDALGFVTFSHVDHSNFEHHDYFLEYLDLCAIPKPICTGDPHIQTWSGMKYDFHGVCDLVLLRNPGFENGLGMDIHIRTEQLKQFSYVSSAVLRIGVDTLEVMGGNQESSYWINKQAINNLDRGIVGLLSGYPIVHEKLNSKQHQYTVNIGKDEAIVMTTFKKFVRVSIENGTKENFGGSLGLMGSYGAGKMVARDGSAILEDPNAFGQEWQVLPDEDMIFHSAEGPQAPEKCYMPVASSIRRRLGESTISEQEAKFACARVSQEDFDMCVFDVMATGDKDVAGAY